MSGDGYRHVPNDCHLACRLDISGAGSGGTLRTTADRRGPPVAHRGPCSLLSGQ